MRSRHTWLAFLALASLPCLAACAPRTSEPTDSLEAALSADDFDATVRALTALPYLPWAYTPDGCYARAFYYSMLLAAKGVPTNHLYVRAKDGTTLAGQWSWHVAPLVTKEGNVERLYVLDPVFDAERALTNVEWVAKQGHPDPASARYPSLHVKPGNSYMAVYDAKLPLANPAAPNVADYREPAFDQLPRFDIGNVAAACNMMHLYIDHEPDISSEQRSIKHRTLGQETRRIVRLLAERDKLAGDAASLPAWCLRDARPDPPAPTRGDRAAPGSAPPPAGRR
jgi:hypothetical protein